MKRKLGAILLTLALALTLGLVTAAPVGAHTESDPFVTDLLAGQHNDVGNVEIWNDGTNLYVKYELDEDAVDEGWYITETHLYVGKTDPNGLTTAPGQFPYDDDDADSVTDTMVTYVILLGNIDGYHMQLNKKGKPTGVMVAEGSFGVSPGDWIYIAAHAGIEKCVVEQFEFVPELSWQRSSEEYVAVFDGYGTQWTPAQGLAIPLDDTQVVWDNGTYHIPPGVPSETSWASWNYHGVVGEEGPSYDGSSDLRRFQATFTMPSECTVTGGTLSTAGFDGIPINDNVYVFVNEELIFWGGTRVYTGEITSFQGMTGVPAARGTDSPAETDNWYIPGTLPALTNLTIGMNAIDVFTEENERWGGMGELMLSLDCEQTTIYTETAWGDGTDFDHPNWAMYFDYHVQCMPGTLWQIGTPDGAVDPVQGASEYLITGTIEDEDSWVWEESIDYYVQDDTDPINTPQCPGVIGPFNVLVVANDGRPPIDTTARLNIMFELHCDYEAGDLVLYYDRYGSEQDDLRIDLDGEIGSASATEGGFQQFTYSLPALEAGNHTISIIYMGGGSGNGHYIDYLKLVYE